ncbi:MAG: hypothetical protein LBP62_04695 [Clostridiales bacterium]|nr:hypothetical protein [Clostridiales bacterium]
MPLTKAAVLLHAKEWRRRGSPPSPKKSELAFYLMKKTPKSLVPSVRSCAPTGKASTEKNALFGGA